MLIQAVGILVQVFVLILVGTFVQDVQVVLHVLDALALAVVLVQAVVTGAQAVPVHVQVVAQDVAAVVAAMERALICVQAAVK